MANVDDIEEEFQGAQSWGKYAFVSSWTSETTETQARWKEYAGLNGIRIGLEKNPFKKYHWDGKTPEIENISYDNKLNIEWILPIKEIFTEQYTLIPYALDLLLKEVVYLSKAKLELHKKQNVINVDSVESIEFNMKLIGTHKSDKWDYQREYRYLVMALPSKLFAPEDFREKIKAIAKFRDMINIPLEHIFLNISDSAFQQMEILTGPLVSLEEKGRIMKMLGKYNFQAKMNIKSSSLEGKIRKR